MFYILRTYVYDPSKIFYELLKPKSSPKSQTEWGAWQSFRKLNFKNLLESHFSFDKKCFIGCTVMIQSAIHFPDLGEYFTYAERMRVTHENFLQSSKVKVFAKNPHILSLKLCQASEYSVILCLFW